MSEALFSFEFGVLLAVAYVMRRRLAHQRYSERQQSGARGGMIIAALIGAAWLINGVYQALR